ncbi:MAG TPA: TRAP transporter substrate-binding protein DctP [Burkholderiales bacterium]|nr:TRAP transporter substrate-binding protein DctP [Burkholderiales bacterium]
MPTLRLVVLAGLGLAMAAAAQAQQPLRMHTFSPEGTASWKAFPEPLAEKIRLATDGKVIIRPFASGVLAGVFEGNKAVLDRRADMAFHYPAFEVNENPASSFISDLPGGMGTDARIVWLLEGGGVELWREYRHSQGLHGIFCGVIGSEVFAHSHKPVRTLADLKGYRYRTAGASTWVMQRIGATPTLVPGPDVFPLLERKGIDGAEYLDPYGNFQLGFHRIARYVIYPGIHAPGGSYELLMRKETWDRFAPDIQRKIELACEAVTLRAYASLQHHNVRSMKAMGESPNNELIRLDPEVVDAIRKAGREWVELKIKEEKAKGSDWMARFAKSFYDFQEVWTKYSDFQVVDRR